MRNSSQKVISAKNVNTSITIVRVKKKYVIDLSITDPVKRLGIINIYSSDGSAIKLHTPRSKNNPEAIVSIKANGCHDTSLYCHTKNTRRSTADTIKNPFTKLKRRLSLLDILRPNVIDLLIFMFNVIILQNNDAWMGKLDGYGEFKLILRMG